MASGPTVRFTAASGTGSARQTHFRLSTEAGPVLTSLRKQTDVPGGHTRHVYLVTDVEPPRKDLFRDNVPPGVIGTFGAQHGAPVRLTGKPGPGEPVADAGFVAVIGGFGARKQ